MNKPPANSALINVCIMPPNEVGDKCVAMSQSLKTSSNVFVLGGDKFAHMTVFMARFPSDKVDAAIAGVEKSLQIITPFLCEHCGYLMTEGRYLEVSYRRSPTFMALHEALIQNLSGLRINPGNPFEEGYFTPYTAKQQKNARETGYDLARDLYRPHITLTRYKEGLVPKVFPALPPAKLSFTLGRIGVYRADDNGAVYEQLRVFEI